MMGLRNQAFEQQRSSLYPVAVSIESVHSDQAADFGCESLSGLGPNSSLQPHHHFSFAGSEKSGVWVFSTCLWNSRPLWRCRHR